MSSQTQSKSRNQSETYLQRILNFVTVEPILIAVNIPLCLLNISVQNLGLEKICRVNLNYDDIVCDNMIDKRLNSIKCSHIMADSDLKNDSTPFGVNKVNFSGTTALDIDTLKLVVCIAEEESQKYGSMLNAYIAPFDAVISVIVVLLAGAWSDKTGRRKPCILLPIIADFCAHIVLLIGAIFMRELPVEFTAIFSILLLSVCGGYRLMYMGIFSYLTDITTEENRVFRFGVVYQIFPVMSIISLPFSGILYIYLGYIKLLCLCLLMNAVGIFYAIKYLKEAPRRADPSNAEIELMGHNSNEDEEPPRASFRKKSVKYSEIFNFSVLRDSLSVVVRKRNYNGRAVVILLFFMATLYNGVYAGEVINAYYFVRTKLNWEALEEAPYAAFSCLTTFIGTGIMLMVCSKMLKMSDALLNIMSAVSATLSRIFFIFVSTNLTLYLATTVDMFGEMITLVAKSIMAAFVDINEIARVYSVFGILENISKFIFVPIYGTIYKHTVATFPNAYFICSSLCYAIVTICAIIILVIVRRKAEKIKINKTLENGELATLNQEKTN